MPPPELFAISLLWHILPEGLMFPGTLDLFVHEHGQYLFQAVSRQHSLLPPLEIGIVSYVPAVSLHDEVDLHVPHHESQVGVGALVANKPVLALQSSVKHSRDAFNLVGVALLGRFNLFRVEEGKPGVNGQLVAGLGSEDKRNGA